MFKEFLMFKSFVFSGLVLGAFLGLNGLQGTSIGLGSSANAANPSAAATAKQQLKIRAKEQIQMAIKCAHNKDGQGLLLHTSNANQLIRQISSTGAHFDVKDVNLAINHIENARVTMNARGKKANIINELQQAKGAAQGI
jgi:hypothetical protein